ncbi:hypothetical protein AB1L42_00460 [Thalassoglobus sp. JC818]|uniref:tetratricopeptide repeat protein n=1 Tax=Thalassoglobus sp. JC818 TaxID=3232136 RepID=UPI00345797BD
MMTGLFEDALKAYEAGEFENSLLLIKEFLRRKKEDGRGWELLGLIQYSRGRIAVSVSAIERATLYVPLRSVTRVCLALGYARVGQEELGRDLLVDLVNEPVLTTELLLQVAAGLDSLGEPGFALQAARTATEKDPDHAQAFYDLGYYVGRCGYPSSVIEALARHAISLEPERACYRIGLAKLLVGQQREDAAYELVRDLSIEQIKQVNCHKCLQRIVELYQSVGDYRRVILCREKLLQLELREYLSDC